jgi:hypothetical protein
MIRSKRPADFTQLKTVMAGLDRLDPALRVV